MGEYEQCWNLDIWHGRRVIQWYPNVCVQQEGYRANLYPGRISVGLRNDKLNRIESH